MIDFFGMYSPNFNQDGLEFLANNTDNFQVINKNGRVTYKGWVGTLRYNVNEYGIQVYGSPATYLYGHNFKTLKHTDLNLFMDQLSEGLHFDVRQMRISRLDITDNLEMTYKPILYKRYMGNLQYLEKDGEYQHNGLRYVNGSREVVLYDKKIGALAKGSAIPPEYQDKNLWRYEYRLMENVNSYLGGAIITRIDDLLDRDVFLHLIDAWEQMFRKIELIDVDAMRHIPYNPNLPYDQHLLACGIIQSGGLGVVLEDLKEQLYLGQLTPRQLRYKKKKFIEAVEAYRAENNLPMARKDELLLKLEMKAEENRMLL